MTEIEILRKMVKHQILQGKVDLRPNDIKRQMGNLAKEFEVPVEELAKAMKPVMDEIFQDASNTLAN
jgi:hypothetical protein